MDSSFSQSMPSPFTGVRSGDMNPGARMTHASFYSRLSKQTRVRPLPPDHTADPDPEDGTRSHHCPLTTVQLSTVQCPLTIVQ